MNEWFKNFSQTIKEKWGKWTIVQKGILIGIFAVIIAAVVILATFSSRPTTVRLFNKAITDETERDRILTRLDQDNIKAYVSSDGYISVETENIAKKWRSKLIAEGYEPSGIDAYQLFDVSRWTRNDFDDKVNWQRATTVALEEHLKQLDGIQQAKVMLSLPDDALFASDQKPVTASVVLYARGGSDVLQSKKSVQGIEHLIMRSVEGLTRDNITIVDGSTNQEINDFEGMEETDRINNIQKEQKVIQKLEAEYSSAVLAALQSTYGVDRVRVATMKIKMDMSKRSVSKEEYSGITIKEDNPNTSYDDSEVVHSLVISEETVNKAYTGTGYNPEGPAGVEGQNPPVYSDMSNVIGKSTEDGAKKNYALNKKNTEEDESPSIDSMSVSVNVDGTWKYPLYDEKGNVRLSSSGGYEREYIPVPEDDLKQVVRLVQGAIGYDKQRGDIVEVTSLQVDRTEQFRKEDEAFIKSQQTKKMFFFILLGIAVVLVTFIVFRIISREIERRRRLREEELLRRQQEERERALWDAKNEGMEVSMTVEERKRQELAENAIALAKEHPEDVAMLIRTWLREEA
ncbi:MAG: flagellar M-ring protein FliF [Treponema sp.]|nr:flagellar M-ring protein FliF [Treponema sp.]